MCCIEVSESNSETNNQLRSLLFEAALNVRFSIFVMYWLLENIIKNFSEYVRPIYQMKKQIANETSELIKLRDWLIPMLMNGQATISD